MQTTVLIPMAGRGDRFKLAGYDKPKPLIDVNGSPMVKMVIDNVASIADNWVFIIRNEDANRLKPLLKEWTKNKCTFITLNHITEGAACTCKLAKEFIARDSALLIANCDQYIEGGIAYIEDTDGEAAILTTEINNGDRSWSYVEVKDGYVTRVAEKKPISDRATVGIYWWRVASNFFDSVDRMIEAGDRTNNEFYVAPTFNYLSTKLIREVRVEDYGCTFHSVGTPQLLQQFLNRRV